MVSASTSSTSPSPTPQAHKASVSPSRPGRFRRLTYLRSRSHSGDTSLAGSREFSRNPLPRPALSRTASATDADHPSPVRDRAGGLPEKVQKPVAATFSIAQPTTSPQNPLAARQQLSPSDDTTHGHGSMTRRRSATTSSVLTPSTPVTATSRTHSGQITDAQPSSNMPSSSRPATAKSAPSPPLPLIRLIPFQDTRSSRLSLSFPTISRTLPNTNAILRIGRYSEKDAPPESVGDSPSDAPIGFKSKVVSRKHCELSYADSCWWIKDVKSSSGTFLNHIRLSQPGAESKPYKIKDGDIVQLGIDFKGGEESIFRCVKMRILCNRGFQQGLNSFNTSAHKQLQQLKNLGANPNPKDSTTDCTICLMAIGPCQSLFIAPCSHTWHYKCIRPIITQHGEFSYPRFLCPNCRAVADLEEDIEEAESWEGEPEAADTGDELRNEPEAGGAAAPMRTSDELASGDQASFGQLSSDDDHDRDVDTTSEVTNVARQGGQHTTAQLSNTQHGASSSSPTNPRFGPATTSAKENGHAQPSLDPSRAPLAYRNAHHINMSIPATRTSDFFPAGWQYAAGPVEDDHGTAAPARQHMSGKGRVVPGPAKLPPFSVGSPPEAEGLMTPRNDAGPFVFDGAAAQSVG